jgi:septal ring factor EnvC (AmiA/AmiB activator)
MRTILAVAAVVAVAAVLTISVSTAAAHPPDQKQARQVLTLKKQVRALKSQNQTLRRQKAALTAGRATLTTQVATLTAERDTARGEVSTLGGHVNSLTGQVAGLTGERDAARSERDTSLGRLRQCQQGAVQAVATMTPEYLFVNVLSTAYSVFNGTPDPAPFLATDWRATSSEYNGTSLHSRSYNFDLDRWR